MKEVSEIFRRITIKLNQIYSSPEYIDKNKKAWESIVEKYGPDAESNSFVLQNPMLIGEISDLIKMKEIDEYFMMVNELYEKIGGDGFDNLFIPYI